MIAQVAKCTKLKKMQKTKITLGKVIMSHESITYYIRYVYL